MPSEPSVLYELPNMMVYHLAHGHEIPLNETPSKLILSMVSTTTTDPFAVNPVEVEDFYLHIQMLPNLDLPLPATTRIFRQFPRSYIIPRLDLDGGQGNSFCRIEFPERYGQDDMDTWETIISQCTAFLEKAQPPIVPTSNPPHDRKQRDGLASTSSDGVSYTTQGYPSEKGQPPVYTPGSGAAAGQEYGYASTSITTPDHEDIGRLVLVDQHDGRIVGELSEGFDVLEQGGVEAGSKAPVEITLPSNAGNQQLIVQPVPPISQSQYLKDASHPSYANSSIVSKAATASKLMVTAATYVASAMESGAQKFTQSTQPMAQPLTFNPTTHDRVRKIHTFTQSAAGVSAKTIGRATHIAQNIGARVTGKGERAGYDRDGKKIPPAKPGILNKSMIAFSTLADGIEVSGKHLLATSSNAATTMVGHRYGDEAGIVTQGLTGSVKNVGLVYIDAAGVSRRALIKGAVRGAILGSVKGGGEVVVTDDSGSSGEIIFPEDQKALQPGQSGGPQRPTTPQPSTYTLPGQSGNYMPPTGPPPSGIEEHF